MKKQSSFLILFALLILTVNCYYEWDYNYPEIDTLTGWPFYQVQHGDTLAQISEREYGSGKLWILLKSRNENLRDKLEDSLLDSSLKIVIPPIEECAQFMDESCLSREEEIIQNDGGMQDTAVDRRFLGDVRLDSSEIQAETLNATKRSYTYFNNLKKVDTTDTTPVTLILENQSNKTLISWLFDSPSSGNDVTLLNIPWTLRPGDKDYISISVSESALDENKTCHIYAKIEGENIWVQFYIMVKNSGEQGQQISGIRVIYDNHSTNPGVDDDEWSLSPKSWSHDVKVNGNFNSSLDTYYYVSQGVPIVGMILFQDPLNLFEILTPSDLWIIKSQNNPLQVTTQKWQIEIINPLTQHYTIIQEGTYLGRVSNSVRLTLSKVESPTDLESFKIIKCSTNEYEISQDQDILVYDSNLGWTFVEKTSPCLKSLSIERDL